MTPVEISAVPGEEVVVSVAGLDIVSRDTETRAETQEGVTIAHWRLMSEGGCGYISRVDGWIILRGEDASVRVLTMVVEGNDTGLKREVQITHRDRDIQE